MAIDALGSDGLAAALRSVQMRGNATPIVPLRGNPYQPFAGTYEGGPRGMLPQHTPGVGQGGGGTGGGASGAGAGLEKLGAGVAQAMKGFAAKKAQQQQFNDMLGGLPSRSTFGGPATSSAPLGRGSSQVPNSAAPYTPSPIGAASELPIAAQPGAGSGAMGSSIGPAGSLPSFAAGTPSGAAMNAGSPYDPTGKSAGLSQGFADKLQDLQQDLSDKGLQTTIGEGYRAPSRQDAIYAQGRTAPGEIVTGVRGGGSYHNFGAAADLVPATGINDKAAQRQIIDTASEDWRGLKSGGTFSNIYDPLHVQSAGSLGDARTAMAGGAAAPYGGSAGTDYAQIMRDAGVRAGLDPRIMEGIYRGEGAVGYIGDHGSSFGPGQLHMGGLASGGNAGPGMGDDFRKETGLDPRIPSTVPQQADWIARKLAADPDLISNFHGYNGPVGETQPGVTSPISGAAAYAAMPPSAIDQSFAQSPSQNDLAAQPPLTPDLGPQSMNDQSYQNALAMALMQNNQPDFGNLFSGFGGNLFG